MGGITWILLVVGVALFLSRFLAKRAVPPNVVLGKPKESPWDELARKAEKAEAGRTLPSRRPETYATRQVEVAGMEEYEEYAPPFSYEEQDDLDEVVVWGSSDANSSQRGNNRPIGAALPSAADSPALPRAAYQRLASMFASAGDATELNEEVAVPVATVRGEASAASHLERSRGGGVFAQGFDPSMAVLYAEVLKPKYLDY